MVARIRISVFLFSVGVVLVSPPLARAVRAPQRRLSAAALDARPAPPTPQDTPIASARFHGSFPLRSSALDDAGVARAVALRLADNPRLFGLPRLPPLDVDFVHRTTVRSGRVGSTLYVGLAQKVGGLIVDGGRVTVTVKTIGGENRVVGLRGTLFPEAGLSARRPLSAVSAQSRLASRLPAGVTSEQVTSRGGRIAWENGRWRAVQEFSVSGEGWRARVDDEGQVRVWDDRHYARDYTGTVTGDVQVFDPLSDPSAEPLARLSVTALPGQSTETDAEGEFNLRSVPNGIPPLQFQLRGPSVRVSNYGGVQQSVFVSSTAPNPLGVHFPAADEETQAQINGFYHTLLVQEWLAARDLAPASRAPVPVWTNFPDTCNAFYFDGAIHFFQAGNNCSNSAFDTVIYHEYGHLIDDAIGGIEDGGLSEGWGDLLAVLVTNQPLIGEHFELTGDAMLRTADNNYIYDPADEIHDQGQAWAGFGWHLREALIADLGEGAGTALAEDLLLPVFWAMPANIPDAVRAVRTADDDNGNLDDGTPHGPAIQAAAARHGLGDFVRPTLVVAGPAGGSTVAGLFNVTGTAADNEAFASVTVTIDGEYTTEGFGPSPWTVTLDADAYAAGTHAIEVRSRDRNGNESLPVRLSLVFTRTGAVAQFDSALNVPVCQSAGAACDSESWLNGRAALPLGEEKHSPTNLGDCPDGTDGQYHLDESLDRLRVSSLDGSDLSPGKDVRLDAAVWAYSAYGDFLDLFYTTNVVAPQWTYLTTLAPSSAGYQILSTTFTLGFGSFQAVRGVFGYGPDIPSACRSWPYDDTDDLVFRATGDFGLSPTIVSLAPTEGVTAGATAVDLAGSNLEFGASVLVGGRSATHVTVLSSDRLRFVTPRGIVGPSDIAVFNPSGRSATLAGGFTYRASPNQTVNDSAAYPNPLRGSGGSAFAPLPADAIVRVFTMNGALVRELRPDPLGSAFWDGRDESGSPVPSGVYFSQITGTGGTKSIKIIIQR